jgi:hypothetical protein
MFFKDLSGNVIYIPYRDNLEWDDILLSLSEIYKCDKRCVMIFTNDYDYKKKESPPIIENGIYNLFIQDIKAILDKSVSVIEINNIYYVNIYSNDEIKSFVYNDNNINDIYDIDISWIDKKDIIYRIIERISVIKFEKNLF